MSAGTSPLAQALTTEALRAELERREKAGREEASREYARRWAEHKLMLARDCWEPLMSTLHRHGITVHDTTFDAGLIDEIYGDLSPYIGEVPYIDQILG